MMSKSANRLYLKEFGAAMVAYVIFVIVSTTLDQYQPRFSVVAYSTRSDSDYPGDFRYDRLYALRGAGR